MKNKITFKIDTQQVPVKKFIDGLEEFRSLMDEITKEYYEGKEKIKWLVSVREGSNNVDFIPTGKAAIDIQKIGAFTIKGIKELEAGKPFPPLYFNTDALEHVYQLGKIFSNGIPLKTQIISDADIQDITSASVATIDKMLGPHTEAIGSIEGILITLTLRGGFHTHILDDLSKKEVRCYTEEKEKTDKSIEDQMLKLFGERVSVWGKISYRRDGSPIHIFVKSIERIERKENLPSITKFRGILKGL